MEIVIKFRFILCRKSDSFKEVGVGIGIFSLKQCMLKMGHIVNECGVVFIGV